MCDSFGVLDLEPLGLVRRMPGLWYARPAGPPPAGDDPDELTITTVRTRDELEAFERATCVVVRVAAARSPRSRSMRPGVLDDPAMHVLVGRVDDDVVSGAMAYGPTAWWASTGWARCRASGDGVTPRR